MSFYHGVFQLFLRENNKDRLDHILSFKTLLGRLSNFDVLEQASQTLDKCFVLYNHC